MVQGPSNPNVIKTERIFADDKEPGGGDWGHQQPSHQGKGKHSAQAQEEGTKRNKPVERIQKEASNKEVATPSMNDEPVSEHSSQPVPSSSLSQSTSLTSSELQLDQ